MIFDLFTIDCSKIQALLFKYAGLSIDSSMIQNIIDIIIIVIMLFMAVKAGMAIFNFISDSFIKKNHWRKQYIKDNSGTVFLLYEQKRIRQRYICTRMQTDAPSIYEEPQMSVANSVSNDFIEHFLNNIFVDNNTSRLYCILADSGMGKTTALVNLFLSYLGKYKGSNLPFEIQLLSLAEGDVIDKIRDVNNPKRTILLLDALDENIEAVMDHKIFLSKLEGFIKEFRFVVMSCRTQFFPSEEEQLKESKIIKDGNNKGYACYQTFYLSPFNDDEIKTYIDRVFGKCVFSFIDSKKKKRRKKADVIVENKKCKSLLVRPMILSNIEQLVNDGREYEKAIDIYDAMVNFWLNREVGRIDISRREDRKETILALSKELAQNIYDNRIERSGYYIGKDEFESFLKAKGLNNADLHLKERSLLNRDAVGLVKFSHKSFLEYFLAYNHFNNDSSLMDFNGIDFAKSLYFELCERYFNENATSNGNCIYIQKNRPIDSCFGIIPNHNRIKKPNFVPPIKERDAFLDAISVNRISTFQIRYLDFMDVKELIILSLVKSNLFAKKHLWMCNIVSVKIVVDNTINLNIFNNFENLRNLEISGHTGMNKNKLCKKLLGICPRITLVVNKKLILMDGKDPMLFMLSTNFVKELDQMNNEIRQSLFKRIVEEHNLYELAVLEQDGN